MTPWSSGNRLHHAARLSEEPVTCAQVLKDGPFVSDKCYLFGMRIYRAPDVRRTGQPLQVALVVTDTWVRHVGSDRQDSVAAGDYVLLDTHEPDFGQWLVMMLDRHEAWIDDTEVLPMSARPTTLVS